MPPDFAELSKWLEKAEHDLRTADVALSLSRPIADSAGFHCQQAVEKLLKAFLYWRSFEFEKILDLRALILDCGKFDKEFLELLDRVAPLTSYTIRYRYPGPNEPTVHEVRHALIIACEVRDFVLARLPPEAHDCFPTD